MKYLLFCAAFLSLGPAFSQSAKKKPKAKTPVATPVANPAARVYYPDFYTFYDSSSHSYLYWEDNRWKSSPDLPAFMKTVDKGRIRVQLLHDENLSFHPETSFQDYYRMYPPMNNMPGVTVPIITIEREHK